MYNYTKILFFAIACFYVCCIDAQQSIHQQELEYYNQQPVTAEQYEILNQTAPVAQQRGGCTPDKIVYGWHPYWCNGLQSNYQWNLLTHLSYFSYEVNSINGNAISTHGWSTAQAVTDALNNGVKVTLTVTLFSDHATFLTNNTSKQTLINNLISLVQSRGAHGVCIDFEGIPSSQKNNFTNFMISLSNQMHTAIPNSEVSTVLYAVDWNNVFDLPAMAPYVDLFIIMGYDYYWQGSSNAGPNDPLFHFGSTYNYTLSKSVTYYLSQGCPANKLVLGLPYYGREWPTSSNTVGAATTGSGVSRTYRYVRDNSTGFYTSANRGYDAASRSTYYIFNNSGWRQCFITEEDDMRERLDFIRKRGIAGMGIWALGYDNGYTEFWNAIAEYMTDCHQDPCSEVLYDIGGGPQKNYYDNENYTFTLAPPNATSITVNFTSFSVATGDNLYVYNGPSTASPQFPGSPFSGTTLPPSLTSSSGAITFRFSSNGSTTAPGWNATYTCTVDNTPPTTNINTSAGWKTQNFTVQFTDNDNSGGSGLDLCFWQALDNNATEWRANAAHGFFNDNFNTAIHPEWTQQTGTWNINTSRLNMAVESEQNSNIYASLTQNNTATYLYHWQMNMGGTGTNRRAGMHFFCDNPALPNRGNSYFVFYRVDNNKCQIYKVTNDTYTLMTDDAVIINPNTWYDCKVIYNPQNGSIKAYLNNILVSQWTDPQPLQTGNSISLRSGGTNVLYDDVKVWKSHNPNSNENISIGNSSTMIRYQNNGVNNPSCRIKSIVKDIADNWSADATLNVNIDWTNPLPASTIHDGLFTDIDTFNLHTEISGNWSAAFDPHSAVAGYEYSVGTSPADSNIISWTNNSINTSFTHTGLNLAYNQMYYVNARAINGAGLKSNIYTSNGQYLTPLVQPATAAFTQQSNIVCLNDSLQLINASQNANAWLWQMPGGSPASSNLQHPKVIYPMAGTYAVTLIAYSPGGNDTITQNINISYQLPPQINFTVNDTILHFPNPFLAISNNSQNATDYYWDFGDGNFSTDVSPWHLYNQTGSFILTLIASNNFCAPDTQQITIHVNSPVGLNPTTSHPFNLYPNPTNGELIIEFENTSNINLPFQIYDVTGKIVYTAMLTNTRAYLNLYNLSNGLYYLVLGNQYRSKLTIQK
jgi:spore germination protein YaaH/PKD repeat protein